MDDAVTAYDPATGKASVQTVQQTFIHHDANLLAVTLRTVSPASASQGTTGSAVKQHDAAVAAHGAHAPPTGAVATSHDETIQTTTNHPWLTADHGWILASFLRLGEPVQRMDGATAIVVEVQAEPGAAVMWDLTVSNLHTFAVGNAAYVVHNCGDIGARRVQHVVDHMDTLAPDAAGGTPDLSETRIHFGDGAYKPDIATDNALFEVGGPGKALHMDAAMGQITRLAKASRYVNKFAYYAWDATDALMPEQMRNVAERWGVRVVQFTMS